MALKNLIKMLVLLAILGGGWAIISHYKGGDNVGNNGGNNIENSGSIVGTWRAEDSTTLTFNPDGTYTEKIQGTIFDTGHYTTSGGQCTMASHGGATATISYSVLGNTMTGFNDTSGNTHVIYTRDIQP